MRRILQVCFRLCQCFFYLTAVGSLDDQSLDGIVHGSDALVDLCLRSLLIVIDLAGLISRPLKCLTGGCFIFHIRLIKITIRSLDGFLKLALIRIHLDLSHCIYRHDKGFYLIIHNGLVDVHVFINCLSCRNGICKHGKLLTGIALAVLFEGFLDILRVCDLFFQGRLVRFRSADLFQLVPVQI